MPRTFVGRALTLNEAKALLPLIKAIAAELHDRAAEKRRAEVTLDSLEKARSPEGLCLSRAELQDSIEASEAGIARGRIELERLGVQLQKLRPVTIHIPGRSQKDRLVFCWQEGDSTINHGHARGEEDDPRRPLRITKKK